MATGDRKDPLRGYNFKLQIAGVIRAAFHEAAGLDGDLEATEKEGETANSSQKIPGLNKVGDVTLKRGVIGDLALWNWYKSAEGSTQRKNGSIVLTDESGKEKARWNFKNGWIAKWAGPTVNADANDVAIETLEIAHEGLTRV
jgi:phage tail-like protein